MESHFVGKWVVISCGAGTAVGHVATLNESARTAVLLECRFFVSDWERIKKDRNKGDVVTGHERATVGPDKYVKKVYAPQEAVFVSEITCMSVCSEAAKRAWLGRPAAVPA